MDFNFEEKSELSIYHSDFECSKCSWPVESFTSFPDFRNGILDEKYFENVKNDKKYTSLVTNITDYESISIWWNKKINEILSNKEFSEKGGGGLGMIEMLRKSGNPIDSKFIIFDKNLYFFNFSIILKKTKNG